MAELEMTMAKIMLKYGMVEAELQTTHDTALHDMKHNSSRVQRHTSEIAIHCKVIAITHQYTERLGNTVQRSRQLNGR